MAGFSKLLSSVLIAVLCATASNAVPYPSSLMHMTHRKRAIKAGLELETFHPASTFEVFGTGIEHNLSKRQDASLAEVATGFISSKLDVNTNTIKFKSGFSGEVTSNAYVKQVHEGVPFANAVANVALNSANKVVAFGSSFVKPTKIAASTPSVSLDAAIAAAEKTLDGTFNQHPATLEYLALSDGSAVLTHVVQIQNEGTGAWFEAFVDAHTGKVVSVTDFVADASYRVLPITKEYLTQGFETLVDPQDLAASPNGWHSTGTTNTTTTAGNNIIAFKGTQSAVTTQSSATLNFVYVQNPATAPTTAVNLDAARTNAFYIGNTLHDLSYRYGFTEAVFNFQTNNFGRGGAQNDRVVISVQDSSGTNNANFATPPDGQSGTMRMFLWTLTSPQRDGSLENDIIIHEYTHGITNRMTGGGTGRCLGTLEAGGMGEGWGDTLANWNAKTSSAVPDFIMGQYVLGTTAGIRTFPYSTSASTNPLRYSSLQTLNEVHDVGEAWANILHNVYAALVSARGFSATAKTNPGGTEGNIVFLHLFLDALTLQPCNPTFLTARTAWIQADANRYAGANSCTLWRAFASRGLGTNAANHNDGTSVPAGC